jgi:hypothetical protein
MPNANTSPAAAPTGDGRKRGLEVAGQCAPSAPGFPERVAGNRPETVTSDTTPLNLRAASASTDMTANPFDRLKGGVSVSENLEMP